jgi:hypothetical protein
MLTLAVLPASQSFAAVSIQDLKVDAVWTAGEKATIKFTDSRKTAKIHVRIMAKENARKVYFDQDVKAEKGAKTPSVIIDVPETTAGAGKTETVILEFSVKGPRGEEAVDQIRIQIRNPPTK